jgi:AAA+ superfamily predicted ATPase
VVATYNTDRELTRAIRASGKFEKDIAINLPNHSTRLEILRGLFSRLF